MRVIHFYLFIFFKFLSGSITFGDVLTISPFNNPIDVIQITGRTLKEVFEYSVSNDPANIQQYGNGFLQVSGKMFSTLVPFTIQMKSWWFRTGIQITFDAKRPVGDRVVELMVRCRRCRVPTYEPVRLDDIYQVATYSFLIEGGDGYSVIKENLIDHTNYGM